MLKKKKKKPIRFILRKTDELKEIKKDKSHEEKRKTAEDIVVLLIYLCIELLNKSVVYREKKNMEMMDFDMEDEVYII